MVPIIRTKIHWMPKAKEPLDGRIYLNHIYSNLAHHSPLFWKS